MNPLDNSPDSALFHRLSVKSIPTRKNFFKDRLDTYNLLMNNFCELRGLKLPISLDLKQFPMAAKRIAPIFQKAFDIPIIDDCNYVEDNPGMKALVVDPFSVDTNNEESLKSVLVEVRNHYRRLN